MADAVHALWNLWRDNSRDPRTLLLFAAVLLMVVSMWLPSIPMTRNGVNVLVVVDITGSMNTRDYLADGRPLSRLDLAKIQLKEMLGKLPCSSRVALALFSERVAFLLFEPIEVCRNYGAVAGAIDAIDWREAWEGDSRIASGLFNAVDMAKELNTDLLFVTDGQEAPPLPFSGGPRFEGKVGEVRGLILGAGGYALSPIPKFDDRGREIGYWGVDDVPHENHSGPPPPDAESRPGYNARNAPFGSAVPKGTEHLSSVREPYLRTLASQTGLTYAHMEQASGIASVLERAATPRSTRSAADLRWICGVLALSALLLVHLAFPVAGRANRFLSREFI